MIETPQCTFDGEPDHEPIDPEIEKAAAALTRIYGSAALQRARALEHRLNASVFSTNVRILLEKGVAGSQKQER